jgi:hypothetical protein
VGIEDDERVPNSNYYPSQSVLTTDTQALVAKEVPPPPPPKCRALPSFPVKIQCGAYVDVVSIHRITPYIQREQ